MFSQKSNNMGNMGSIILEWAEEFFCATGIATAAARML